MTCRLADLLGKEKVGPHLKNLEHNAWEHSLQFILPVVVAIFVFLTRHVKQPPPTLFFRDPILYVAMVQNASGIVMLQFLRHAGLPTMWWHRAGRAEDSRTLDDLHALAFHWQCGEAWPHGLGSCYLNKQHVQRQLANEYVTPAVPHCPPDP